MIECRDFFQERGNSGCRRSSSSAAESVEELGTDHCLELTLGLGPPPGSPSSSQAKTSSVFNCLPLQTGPSISESNSLQAPHVQLDALERSQNSAGQPEGSASAKQRGENLASGGAHLHPFLGGEVGEDVAVNSHSLAGDDGIPSRDQVWMTLQKNGTVSGQNLDQQKDISTLRIHSSALMHVLISGNDSGKAENCLIRRSSRIGVADDEENHHVTRSSSNCAPYHTVLRHLSSTDSCLNVKSLSVQGQETEACRNRKEMLAQRTQEARKRRKNLIEEKQQKKSKHGSGLQCLGRRHSIYPNDKLSPTEMLSDEDGVLTPQSDGEAHEVSQQESEGNVKENVLMVQNSVTEEGEQETQLPCLNDGKVSSSGEIESPSHSMHSKEGATNCTDFPFSVAPHSCTVEPTTHTTIPTQPAFPFPFLAQYPASSQSEKGSSFTHGTYSVVTGPTPATPFPVVLMSKASSSKVGASLEGKGCGNGKPVSAPLLRTSSSQSGHAPPNTQTSFPSSLLKSLSSLVSDAGDGKLERQQSMPVHAQNGGGGLRQVDRKGGATLVGRGVRQGEASMESQLASQQSGVGAACVSSGSVQRQKRGGPLLGLQWVTTTGKGPHGKTVTGVMYIVNGRHVRLVCSCHGTHMSPTEFVEHAGSSDLSNPERHIVVSPLPSLHHQRSVGACGSNQ